MVIKDRLVLIDGNAILHRAYHAVPKFTTSKGAPVGAVFGFVSMLLKILSDLKPAYIVVTFDRPKPTFRQELFVGYQAGRPAMDDALVPQVADVHKVVESFNIPIFEVDGYEADDVIGTLAKQALEETIEDRGLKVGIEGRKLKIDKKKIQLPSSSLKDLPSTFHHLPSNLEVIIVSGDRDLLQLVNSHVKVYMPVKGLSEAKMYGSEEVREKYGLDSSQVIDMKALMGDASDNYPGVTGIGPKTASELLKKYQTLENVYKHLGELSERVAKALADGAESAGLAKKLATIVTDVPIHLKLEECKFEIKDKEKAVETLQEFELKTLTNRFLALLGGKPVEDSQTKKIADQLSLV